MSNPAQTLADALAAIPTTATAAEREAATDTAITAFNTAMEAANPGTGSVLTFTALIAKYSRVQSEVQSQITALASNTSSTNPGQFLLMQFKMAYITQMGDSISNLISQVNSMINNAVRNQKTQ